LDLKFVPNTILAMRDATSSSTKKISVFSVWLIVMWVIFKSRHYVDLWLMFTRLAYGMSYATCRRSANQQMILLLVHQVNLGS
jgi:hypothetical protein